MTAAGASLSAFEKAFELHYQRYLAEWMELLRFKSVSTDPGFSDECRLCAKWLQRHLDGIGFQTELLETETKPVVYGIRPGRKDSPVVLFYGHYDVQPPDPVESWLSPPFEPQERQGRIYARGAQDNKGQLFYFIKAAETLIQNDLLECTVKILIEGEEESGSAGIKAGLSGWREKIQADVLMICDTGTSAPRYATITMGLRGIVSLEARLGGIKYDLHSGLHGGAVLNPATELARIVASLHNSDGSIAVSGFYDDVAEPSPEERKIINAAPFDEHAYREQIGILPDGGEKGLGFAERRGLRPTIEVNGFSAGYTGEGFKTIIPASALVKLSARLARGQDPGRCLGLIEDHLKAHTPPSLTLSVTDREAGGPAVSIDLNSPILGQARQVLDQICPSGTLLVWRGSSIPIVSDLVRESGAEPLLAGFSLEEDNMHAPNESFSIDQFKKGYLYACMMLSNLKPL